MNDTKSYEACLIAEDKTQYYADSIEWCPISHLSNLFVCGTYQLDEGSASKTQVRVGSLILYKLNLTNEVPTSHFELSTVESISTSGILDIKWCPQLLSGNAALSFVCSDGKLFLKHLAHSSELSQLSDLAFYDLAQNEEKLVLSVDWAWEQENSAYLMTSDTKGFLSYFHISGTDLRLLNSWKAHNFEAWISAFNYFNPNIVYSGADDCLFKGWDLRELSSPTFINKHHSMGVTAISKHKLNENLLISGSYDEHIRLWDVRNMRAPISELSVAGGIWRLKWHPKDPNYLISASMLNGFHIVSIKNGELSLEYAYKKHKSLAYGVDWCHMSTRSASECEEREVGPKAHMKNIIASCSFYDSLVQVWEINL